MPFPSPGDLPDPGIEPMSPASTGGLFTLSHQGSLTYPLQCYSLNKILCVHMQTPTLLKQLRTHRCAHWHLKHADLCAWVSPPVPEGLAKQMQDNCSGKAEATGDVRKLVGCSKSPSEPWGALGSPVCAGFVVGWLLLAKQWHQSPPLAQKVP